MAIFSSKMLICNSRGPMCCENVKHKGPPWLRCLTMFKQENKLKNKYMLNRWPAIFKLIKTVH